MLNDKTLPLKRCTHCMSSTCPDREKITCIKCGENHSPCLYDYEQSAKICVRCENNMFINCFSNTLDKWVRNQYENI
jgi:hypothetical protein